jgi:hypothetical protein
VTERGGGERVKEKYMYVCGGGREIRGYVCMCVCEREREIERKKEMALSLLKQTQTHSWATPVPGMSALLSYPED